MPVDLKKEGYAYNPIFQGENGLWFFWDETWANNYGPYNTEEEAKQELDKYCKYILGSDGEQNAG
jgi:hypothetical protein